MKKLKDDAYIKLIHFADCYLDLASDLPDIAMDGASHQMRCTHVLIDECRDK